MIDLIVIGAGFAGVISAIKAARYGLNVLVLEHMDSAGRKLKMTGNGKCNLAPGKILLNSYHSTSLTYDAIDGFDYEPLRIQLENNSFYNPIATAFSDISIDDELMFFRELGLDPVLNNGGYYPSSNRASSVLDALLSEVSRLGIDVKTDIAIRGIKKEDVHFRIDTKTGEYSSKYVLLATGGKSYKNTGSDGSGHIYARKLGHNIVEMKPVLCGLISSASEKYGLSGIRVKSILTLYIDGNKIIGEYGELQLTDYGISGICVFNLSSYISPLDLNINKAHISVDFIPEKSEGYLYLRLKELRESEFTSKKKVVEALQGILHDKIICAACQELGISPDDKYEKLTDYELQQLSSKLKTFCFDIEGIRGFDNAQCTAGGIDFAEVNTKSLESKIVKGMYFAGEILDINGNCGGYNLLWAYYSADKSVNAIMDAYKNDKNN